MAYEIEYHFDHKPYDKWLELLGSSIIVSMILTNEVIYKTRKQFNRTKKQLDKLKTKLNKIVYGNERNFFKGIDEIF